MTTAPRFFNFNLYYHIYNCGVENRRVFLTAGDYHRFLEVVRFYLHDQRISYAQFQDLSREARETYLRLNPKGLETLRVKIISFCLMPNHFHFLLKHIKENGITQFIADISNSHTRYFNIKNERIGSLFQGTFKSKEISTEESLLQVTRYIHLNPVALIKANLDRKREFLRDYPFSSYKKWISSLSLNPKGLDFTDHKEILQWVKLAGGKEAYQRFVEAKIEENPKVGIENLALDP